MPGIMDSLYKLKASDPWPRTHNALNDYYQYHFREAVRRGDIEPYVWPYRSLGIYLLLAYLLLPPTNSRFIRLAFYPVYGGFTWFSLRTIFDTKSGSLVVTYLLGMVHIWGILWVASRMLFNDHRTARRVERRIRPVGTRNEIPVDVVGASTGREQNGHAKNRPSERSGVTKSESNDSNTVEHYWQTLPAEFIRRVDFVIDLLFAMRGPGWAHQARSIPGPPQAIASQLHPPPPSTKPATQDYSTRKELLWTNGVRLLKFLFYLDIIKTIMTHDAYFLGFVDPPAPAPSFLPVFIQQSPILTKWYRLILSMFATRTALAMVFCLSPLFFSGILGPKIMGLRAEPWYYSDFGGDWRVLLSDGIAGWWGSWWHQIFRLGFEAPSKWLMQKLNISPRSPQGKLLAVFTAFFCSGLLHGFASISMIPDTKPWSGPLLFFLLQGVGTVMEATASQVLKTLGITQRTPQLIRDTVVVVWLATWAYYTGPFLIEDFARGGVWLFEPVPFSVMKMLGFGEPNDHWWRWRGRNVFWYTGDRWWKSGITV